MFNAALFYIVFYTIRPLILFPASILTIASGLIFGPWLGILFTIIGENMSANFAFLLARWFGRSVVVNHETDKLKRWDKKLEENGVITVMTLRLIMLPFDMVNFACGLTAIRQCDYAIGTFIGIMPALIGFVLIGGVASSGTENRLLVLFLSIFFVVTGIALATWIKKREKD